MPLKIPFPLNSLTSGFALKLLLINKRRSVREGKNPKDSQLLWVIEDLRRFEELQRYLMEMHDRDILQ